MKIPSFCAVFSCSNCADREKDKPNHRFSSIGSEGLKLSKVRRKNWLAQIFRKDLTERKLERTRIRNNVFSHKVYVIGLEKASTYSVLAVIELGSPVSESSPRISKFYDHTDSEHKFNERKSKIG